VGAYLLQHADLGRRLLGRHVLGLRRGEELARHQDLEDEGEVEIRGGALELERGL